LSRKNPQYVALRYAQGTILVKKPKQIQSPKEQAAAFRKAARELGCDDNEGRFQAALRTVAKHKPEKQKVHVTKGGSK
jgi:hypothetical protein